MVRRGLMFASYVDENCINQCSSMNSREYMVKNMMEGNKNKDFIMHEDDEENSPLKTNDVLMDNYFSNNYNSRSDIMF